jgi:DNA gyrase subunit A
MDLVQDGGALLVVTANGMGKRTALGEYPAKGRATGGVISIKLRAGDEVAVAQVVWDRSVLTLISTGGTLMRTPAVGISQLGRATQGVAVMHVSAGDRVSSLSVEEQDDDDERSQQILLTMDGE